MASSGSSAAGTGFGTRDWALPNVPESHQAACEGYRERWETNDHRDSLEIRPGDLAALGFLLSFQGGRVSSARQDGQRKNSSNLKYIVSVGDEVSS